MKEIDPRDDEITGLDRLTGSGAVLEAGGLYDKADFADTAKGGTRPPESRAIPSSRRSAFTLRPSCWGNYEGARSCKWPR